MPATSHRPNKLLMLAEGPRAMFELGAFAALRGPLSFLPRGDGHPVLVLPGFLAGDGSTRPMRGLLKSLGYDVHGWGMGRNLRIDSPREREMNAVLARIADEAGRKVSIVGWSLGGVYAREMAKAQPDIVRQVISLGSPITNDLDQTNATPLFKAINGEEPEPKREGRYRDLAAAPPVPTTSILTKSDGIVAWQAAVQRPEGGQTENIEVLASHCGLGVNPLVMVAIADRLAQPEGEWKPFERTGLRALMFGSVSTH